MLAPLRLASLLAAVPTSAAAVSAQTVELSGPFVVPETGFVVGGLHLPGGGRAVYQTYPDWTWFSAPLDGSAPPIRLSESNVGNSISFSADGSVAVYYGGWGLVSVATDGSSAPVAIDSFAIEDDHNFFPHVSPDGQWAVARTSDWPLQLRSARTDGSGAHVLFDGYPSLFAISPDSARVFFRPNDGGLYSVPIDGSAAAIELSVPHVAGGGVESLLATPDGSRVVYAGDLLTDGVVELFSVLADGSAAPVVLSGSLPNDVSTSQRPLEITADGSRVVWHGDHEVAGRADLWSAPVDGSAPPAKLSGPLGADRDVKSSKLAPDGRRVLFLADRDADELFELFLARTSGAGAPVQLSGPLAAGADVFDFVISADSSVVVYRVAGAPPGAVELFAVPIGRARSSQPRPIRLDVPPVAGASVRSGYQIVGERVLYSMQLPGGAIRSFSVPRLGGPTVALTPELGPGGSTDAVAASPEGVGAFTAKLGGAVTGTRVFSVPLDGSAPALDLTGPLGFGFPGEAHDFRLAPGGRDVVFRADADVTGAKELWGTTTDGRGARVKLNGQLDENADVFGYALSPDGARVAYTARQEGDPFGSSMLYEGPLDGSAPAARRSDTDGSVLGFEWAAGSRLVYRFALAPGSSEALYSVPADGSGPPARLDVPGGGPSLPSFEVSPDGSRVVYRSDELTSAKFELFSAPADASAPRVKVHGTFPAGRDVQLFRIDPTGERVLFTGDLNTATALDLYVAPIDASATQVRLSDALAAGRSVREMRASPDGTRVAYTADRDADDVFELYSVPIDRSSAPVELSAPLAAGADVHEFEFTPDGQRVVYRAGPSSGSALFVAPAAGGAPALELSAPLAPNEGVLSFAFARGGATVLFRRRTVPFDERLRAVAIEGGSERDLGGGVTAFALDASGTRVAFASAVPGGRALALVSLDGPGAARELELFEDVVALAFTATGRVVHVSEDEPGAQRLFATKIPRQRREAP